MQLSPVLDRTSIASYALNAHVTRTACPAAPAFRVAHLGRLGVGMRATVRYYRDS
jgi:hypothetical protein